MLLNLDEFETSSVRKLVHNINQYDEKKKVKKLYESIEELAKFAKDKDSDECKEIMYIYSILVDDFSDIVFSAIGNDIKELIKSKDNNIRLNAVIIYGQMFAENIDNAEKQQLTISGDKIDEFLDLVKDQVEEIRGNAIFFIEQWPVGYFDYILPKLNLLMDVLIKTDNVEVVDATFFIIGNVWLKTLPIKLSIFKTLTELYRETSDIEKKDKMIKFMASEFHPLNDFLKSRDKIKHDEVMTFLSNRHPLVKIYDIEKVSKESNMSYNDVLNNFERIKGDESIFRFLFSAKKKYFIEIELEPLLNLLGKNKSKVEDLIYIFGDIELDSISLLNLLIKKLVKSKFIRGFISKSHFYSYDHIKESMMKDIKKKGSVNLDEHAKSINYNFIVSIAEDINKETKFTGIFNKERSLFLTLSSISKKIEKVCMKASTFDLSEYWEIYNKEDYYLIEKECIDKFFTKYHHGMNWLTYIGNTRLTGKFQQGQLIGFINLSKISDELDVPSEISKQIVDEWLESKPGLWDKSKTIFYFTKYLKKRLNELDKSVSEKEKEEFTIELAKELNLSKELIVEKLNQEITEIIDKIKTKPSIDINSYCRSLDMKRDQFINFVNSLNVEYLIQQNEMIFDPIRIGKKKNALEKEIFSKGKHGNLFVPDLSRDLKLSEHMIIEAIEKYHKKGKIKGILINEELFLTESGLIRRFLDNEDYITIETVFPERKLDEEEENYVISILENLVNKGELIGEYDDANKEFKSEEAMVVQAYDDEKSNAEEMLRTYKGFMVDTYQKVKEMYLNKKDIKPGDLKRKEFLIKRIMDEVEKWEFLLTKVVKKAEKSFDSLEDAGELTFGEVLDAEEVSEKIDGEFILSEFTKWKNIIMDLEQNIDKAGALKKKLKDNEENEELKTELEELYEKAHFYDSDL